MIDINSLQKGEVISADELEILFGCERDRKPYRLKTIKLIERIQEESNQAGTPLLCKCDGEDIRILTDTEALSYKAEEHDLTCRRIYRYARHLNRIDSNNLTKKKTVLLEREIINQSRIAQVVKRERRTLGMKPHRT
jgi:hypothetical protein